MLCYVVVVLKSRSTHLSGVVFNPGRMIITT